MNHKMKPVPPRMPSDDQADVNGVQLKTFHVGSLDLAKARQGVQQLFNEWSRDNLTMDIVCIENSVHSIHMRVSALKPDSITDDQIMHHIILWVWHQPKRLPADVKVLLMQVQNVCTKWKETGLPSSDKASTSWAVFEGIMTKLIVLNDKVWKW